MHGGGVSSGGMNQNSSPPALLYYMGLPYVRFDGNIPNIPLITSTVSNNNIGFSSQQSTTTSPPRVVNADSPTTINSSVSSGSGSVSSGSGSGSPPAFAQSATTHSPPVLQLQPTPTTVRFNKQSLTVCGGVFGNTPLNTIGNINPVHVIVASSVVLVTGDMKVVPRTIGMMTPQESSRNSFWKGNHTRAVKMICPGCWACSCISQNGSVIAFGKLDRFFASVEAMATHMRTCPHMKHYSGISASELHSKRGRFSQQRAKDAFEKYLTSSGYANESVQKKQSKRKRETDEQEEVTTDNIVTYSSGESA